MMSMLLAYPVMPSLETSKVKAGQLFSKVHTARYATDC